MLGQIIPSDLYHKCLLCPRHCGVDRTDGARGVCGMGDRIRIGRAAPHFWEEPCISGTKGSGAVFFTGCALRCSYCQNRAISRAISKAISTAGGDLDCNRGAYLRDSNPSSAALPAKTGRNIVGREITADELAETFLKLQEQEVHNINLVTAAHFTPGVVQALEKAKKQGLNIPVVWNSSGYESLETLHMLDGLIDIYLPDCKYVSAALSGKYSGAPDYFEVCAQALDEMVRQTGEPLFYPPTRENTDRGASEKGAAEREDAVTRWVERGPADRRLLSARQYNTVIMNEESDDYAGPLMARGTIVRHLALPGGGKDSERVISFLHETFGDRIYLSLMAQYTPVGELKSCENHAIAERNATRQKDSCAEKESVLKSEADWISTARIKEVPDLGRRLREDEYEALVEYCLALGVENAFLQGLETADESFIPEWDE